ncbi:bifunctional diaminohydroxyphosphoribosylaminopyrimidine deaminase/5-amino-6-(5-phosphoribosylamino)uracil reductase RibD [Rhizosaccharibacter radicis]|uniref:bifunctional diaminohydroxyphosphoribosylaminopyrimidine deaminase/5-amino-6-(5-phosphoribosylamino)uracil reductase RibD n=1 Tax=Rhizosaccharibacter radicis TaxID=2782605 RepID=UPI003BF51480
MPPPVRAAFIAAIDEACRFLGNTAPNPPVGCAVLDANGEVLAVGAHHRAGEPHAEALALRLCQQRGLMHRARTLVVTLEPCNHHGRTPPCTEAILATPVREVWVGTVDPNPRVAGGGIGRLRAAGRTVHGLPAASPEAGRCRALIAPFAALSSGGRPWISVKQALDRAGSMRPPAGRRTFTSEDSLLLAHRMRRATDAVVVGTGTVLADAPELTVRRLPDHADRRRVLAVVGRRPVPASWRAAASERGFRLIDVPVLADLPAALAAEGAMWALVEAGPGLLGALREQGLWDDWLQIRQAPMPGPPAPATGPAAADAPVPDLLRLAVASRHGALSPLSLLPELSSLFPAEEPS